MLVSAWNRFTAWFNALELDESVILVTFALLVGSASALGVVLFFKLIDLAHVVLFRAPVGWVRAIDFPVYRPLLTAAGFALAAHIARRYAGGEDGPNIPFVQRAVARRGGVIPVRESAAHAAASVVTLGSGGSAGSEGPVAVIGATAGSFFGRAFRFTPERVKVLVAAGAASGISASFNAPIAGAFFALEEVLGSLTITAFPAVVVSSVSAAVISRAVFGNHPAFPIPEEYGYSLIRELLIFFPLLGAAGGIVGVIFVRTQRAVRTSLRRLPVSPALLPWFAGAVVGLLVLASNGTLVGYGHLAVRLDVFGRMAFGTLVLLAVGKILVTSLTLNGGGSGGVFTPSLYLGAATGGAFGVGISHLVPSLGLHPEPYALVGMGVVVAAATHAPITAILIVFEMTNDYAIVLPLMLSVVVGYLVARFLERDSLYTLWLRDRGEDLTHGADRDLLGELRVRDVFDSARLVLRASDSIPEILGQLERATETELPVVTREGRFIGIVRVSDLGQLALEGQDLAPVLLAADIALSAETATPEDSLLDAIRRMGVRGTTVLPVIEPGTRRLIGIVTRSHILAAYERTLAERASRTPPGVSARTT